MFMASWNFYLASSNFSSLNNKQPWAIIISAESGGIYWINDFACEISSSSYYIAIYNCKIRSAYS